MKIKLRKHITRFALLAGIVLLLAACGRAGGDAPPTVETFDVTGTVTDGAGAGIADVTISFGSSASSVTTDSDGAWAQTGLTGDVTITPKHDDYIFDPESRKVSKAQNNVNFTGYKKGPLSLELIASDTDAGLGGTITLTAALAGTDAPQATITWDTPADGTLEQTSNTTVRWQAPTGSGITEDTYTLEVTATHAGTTLTDSVTIQTHLCNTGDVTDPTNPCTISTATQLQAIGAHLNGHFALSTDIDTTEVKNWHNNAGFKPIGDNNDPFAGTFNGQGHTISNLYMNYPNGDDIGLFGYTDSAAELKNIILSSTKIVTDGAVIGSLVGTNEGHIENSSTVNPKVKGSGSIGGLVGLNRGGTISGSSATGENTLIEGRQFVGGLVGQTWDAAEIVDSHTEDVTVKATSSDSGGLIGRIADSSITGSSTTNVTIQGEGAVGGVVGTISNGTIEETVAYEPAVSGDSLVGGLAGWNNASTITNSHTHNATITGTEEIGGLVGENSNGTIEASTTTGASVEGETSIGGLVGNSYGGSVVNSATATTVVVGLKNVGGLIGLKATGTIGNSIATEVSVEGSGEEPKNIGGLVGRAENTSEIADSKTEDANVIALTGTNIGGLVGYSLGRVEDSKSINPQIEGHESVGGLVGQNAGGVISDSCTTGQHAEIQGTVNVGGLVGLNTNNAEIISSHSEDVTVQANDSAGGLVGRNQSNSTISESSTTNATVIIAQHGEASSAGGAVGVNGATIEQTSAVNPTVTGKDGLGGLVGWNQVGASITESSTVNATVTGNEEIGGLVGNSSPPVNGPAGIITKSSAQKPVVTGYEQVGGLVGSNGGKIEESYATGLSGTSYEGSVTTTANTAGGLVGYNGTNAEVKRSYSSGLNVSGEDSGGLIGYNNGKVEETYSLNILPGSNSGGLIAQAGTNSNVTNSYWATEQGGPASSAGGSKKQPAQMVQKTTYSGWSETYWSFPNQRPPTLKNAP